MVAGVGALADAAAALGCPQWGALADDGVARQPSGAWPQP